MKKEIRILIVEDVAADVIRINHELRRGGLSFCSKRVEAKEEFLHEILRHCPDVILSDRGLPSFDGFTALAIARDQCPHVPFIFVSGGLGEHTAVETLKSGATDYVLKDRLSELVPAVQRALRETEEQSRRQQIEKELRASEERFRTLVEGVKDYAIVMLDTNGRVTSWNSGAQWLHGYRSEEVIGRHLSLFYLPEEADLGRPDVALQTAAAEGRFEEEGLRVGKSGKTFRAMVVITALRDSNGKLRGYAHVTRDTTERRLVEEALRKSEALKSAVLDTVLDAIISIDHQGVVQEWNRAAQRIFGYGRSEALGRPLDELIIPASLSRNYQDGVANYLMTGVGSLVGRPIELTLRRADRTEFPAEAAITRVLTEAEPRCTALIRDITERKQAEEALQRSEERWRMLVEGVKDYAIYLLDPQGRIATWNSGAERIMGYRAQEVVGEPFSLFFPPADVEAGLPQLALKTAEKDGESQYEGWRVRKDGSRFWVEGTITALRDQRGKLCGFSKVAHDTTQHKEAEEQIRHLNAGLEERVRERTAQLEAANAELGAFTYSVSHDLRAPLLHIAGYVEMLEREAGSRLDDKSKEHLQIIADGARQMGTRIDALLDFSRIGSSELRRRPVRIARLVAAVRRALQRETTNRNIEWKIGELPEVEGDPVLLKQVMVNLLANAIKYTRTRALAKIEIGASRSQVEDIIYVRDNGVGFEMEDAKKLFGVFQRLHPGREFEGTGIGLAHVRRIIHRHGGRTWAEGSVDRGATFYVSIPV